MVDSPQNDVCWQRWGWWAAWVADVHSGTEWNWFKGIYRKEPWLNGNTPWVAWFDTNDRNVCRGNESRIYSYLSIRYDAVNTSIISYNYIYNYMSNTWVMFIFIFICLYHLRKFRSHTSNLWTDAATVVRAVREEKKSEEKESVERRAMCAKR